MYINICFVRSNNIYALNYIIKCFAVGCIFHEPEGANGFQYVCHMHDALVMLCDTTERYIYMFIYNSYSLNRAATFCGAYKSMLRYLWEWGSPLPVG